MKALIGGTSLTLALLLAGCGGEGGNTAAPANTASYAPLAQVEAPNGDWTKVVEETPEGGFRMGNPNAPVKLVEYASVSCPHCAAFSEEASDPLQNQYVKSGQVSWEFRHFLLFPTDAGISLLARCQGAGPFFRLTEQIYADQQSWMTAFQGIPQAEQQRIQALPPRQQVGELVKAGGMDQFFRQRGMPEQKINACLADEAQLQKLIASTNTGVKEGVQGTPSFFINGEIAEGASDWKTLEPKLREAIG